MYAKINSKYLENYATEFTNIVCEGYFMTKKYMNGQGIIQLTPSSQVNFFILKALFEAWQLELEKLKSNPYFDYRNNAVHDALRDFMNVLSRSIKIEREDFEPLVTQAVANSIQLAVDPVRYFVGELDNIPAYQLNDVLKENKKYYKWHSSLISNLIDRAGLANTHEAYKNALELNFEEQKNQLDAKENLLNSLNELLPLDLNKLFNEEQAVKGDVQEIKAEQKSPDPEHTASPDQAPPVVETISPAATQRAATETQAIDPLQAWARFESEEYTIMKGSIGNLSDSIGINQRFMFTKELFDGNPDLMKHALTSIDQCENFADAISLLNERFVGELNWQKESEAVGEFLQLIFRKFDQKE